MSVFKNTYSRALSLLAPSGYLMRSDVFNIPYPGTLLKSGTGTASTSTKLIDSATDFEKLEVQPGDIVWQTTSVPGTFTVALVTNVEDENTINVNRSIFVSATDGYSIFRASNMYFGSPIGCNLYFPSSGTAKVTTIAGEDTIINIPSGGYLLPTKVTRLCRVGTTYTTENITALW